MNNIIDKTSISKTNINNIVVKAMSLPKQDRLRFIYAKCQHNATLFNQCKTLLNRLIKKQQDKRQLETKTAEQHKPSLPNSVDRQKFGSYKAEKLIGIGAASKVYKANKIDNLQDQSVALKVLRKLDKSKQLITRFNRERIRLANLTHPNIAQIQDSGISPLGQPFLVMELIDGIPVDQYCQRYNLSLEAKLKLFIKIGAAISHAHQQLILHRDIKPSNILITEVGVVKILDFSITRLQKSHDSKEGALTSGLQLMSRYASPEQVRSEMLSTKSDQYSLGVLLYQLLCGIFPYEVSNAGFYKTICESEAEPPSKAVYKNKTLKVFERRLLSRSLKGDLDHILLKALNKNPQRRYESIREFIGDIEAYLQRQPVKARKPSIFYNSKRFLQRNFVAVSLITIIIISLVAYQAKTIKERDLAIQNSQQAQQNEQIAKHDLIKSKYVQDFILDLFKITEPGENRGNAITAREILDNGVDRINAELNEQPEIKSELLNTLGVAHRELGLYQDAQPLLKEALTLRQNYFPESSAEQAITLNDFGVLQRKLGDYETALNAHQQALVIYQNFPSDEITNKRLAETYKNLASAHTLKGEHELAIKHLNKAQTILIEMPQQDFSLLGDIFQNLATVHQIQSNYDFSIEYLEKALTNFQKIYPENHVKLAHTYNSLGTGYHNRGNYDKAIENFNKALNINTKIFGINHPEIANSYQNLGNVYYSNNEFQKAIEYTIKSLEINSNTLDQNHPWFATTYNSLAKMYVTAGDLDSARLYNDQALEIALTALSDAHPNLAGIYTTRGAIFKEKGEFNLAITTYEQALSILTNAFDKDHPDSADIYDNLGSVYFELGDINRSLDYYRKAEAVWQHALGRDHPKTVEIKDKLASLGKLTAESEL